jgi:ABC-type bacteriocin/lantibiotic exporter with double-glycine peptidase domain
VSTDAPKIADIISIYEPLSLVPLQVIGCTILLWHILGLSFIPGLFVLICFMLINISLSTSISEADNEAKAARDKRIQTTAETLEAIRFVKFLALERYFSERVNDKRSTELKAQYSLYAASGRRKLLGDLGSFMMYFVSFLTYTLVEKRPLYPSVAFAAIWLLDRLKESFNELSDANLKFREVLVATSRLEKFLNEDVPKYEGAYGDKIGFRNGSFCWNPTSQDERPAFSLKNIDIMFAIRALNIIKGPSGSGKTTLLISLLGQLIQTGGTIHLPQLCKNLDIRTINIAYCAQEPKGSR